MNVMWLTEIWRYVHSGTASQTKQYQYKQTARNVLLNYSADKSIWFFAQLDAVI